MFWLYVTVGFLVIISIWGAIDLVMEVRKKRKEQDEENQV